MIVLGRLTAPYGVRGWLRVACFGDDPLSWKRMPTWWVGPENGPWEAREPAECRMQGSALLVRFAGTEDRTAAEALVGSYVVAPREALPTTGRDEFYWADLIGLRVENEVGESLGRVAEVIAAGPQDVLRVADEAGAERLIPFVQAVVKQVDVPGGRVVAAWEVDW